MPKLKIGLIFGGRSGEHEVSLVSARSIFNALDKKKYAVKLIGIDKSGVWHLGKDEGIWIGGKGVGKLKLNAKLTVITAIAEKGKIFLINTKDGKRTETIDVFFPITHGTFGEDGCLQGFFELLGAAYVGPNVLGSAVGMNKDVMKRLFREAGIPIGKFYAATKTDLDANKITRVIKDLGFPIFVKPANLGSSVGISKARNKKELDAAMKMAFKFDNKIILEENISGREIECSVLGNEKPIASFPGEIKLASDFYSYEAKYINDKASTPIPRADIPEAMAGKIKRTALEVLRVLGCEGMGRVDFFLTKQGKIYVNEINTLPGFTQFSMYPKMFERSGVPYPKLLDKLIALALERKKRNDKLKRTA
jgi:D-alanine-D-alanine ligase